jgi:hypothetical protein
MPPTTMAIAVAEGFCLDLLWIEGLLGVVPPSRERLASLKERD